MFLVNGKIALQFVLFSFIKIRSLLDQRMSVEVSDSAHHVAHCGLSELDFVRAET